MHSLLIAGLLALALPLNVFGDSSYTDFDNDFVDPNYILAKDFSSSTCAAQTTVIQYADFLAAQGPWCKRPKRYFYYSIFANNHNFASCRQQNRSPAFWQHQ